MVRNLHICSLFVEFIGAVTDVPSCIAVPVVAIRVEVSPNGNDFIRCAETVQSYVSLIDGIFPGYVPVSGGTAVTVTGRAMPDTGTMAAKLDITIKPGTGKAKPLVQTLTVPLHFIDSRRAVFDMPRLEEYDESAAPTPKSVLVPQASVSSTQSLTAQSCPAVVEGVGLDDATAIPPLLPPGQYPVRVSVALDGSTYEDAGLSVIAYGALLSHGNPLCGPVSGGTVITLVPDAATQAVQGWFLATGQQHVRVFNDQMDVVGAVVDCC